MESRYAVVVIIVIVNNIFFWKVDVRKLILCYPLVFVVVRPLVASGSHGKVPIAQETVGTRGGQGARNIEEFGRKY